MLNYIWCSYANVERKRLSLLFFRILAFSNIMKIWPQDFLFKSRMKSAYNLQKVLDIVLFFVNPEQNFLPYAICLPIRVILVCELLCTGLEAFLLKWRSIILSENRLYSLSRTQIMLSFGILRFQDWRSIPLVGVDQIMFDWVWPLNEGKVAQKHGASDHQH